MPEAMTEAAVQAHRVAATDPVGWGVIGCGWVARDFAIPAIRAAGRLVAVHDHDPAAPEAVGASQCALDTMLSDPAVEAIYVATPNHAHAPAVIAAAHAGKAILCEKPLAATAEDARAMIEAVTAAGVPFATAYDQRFHGAHRMIARLVADGTLGQLTHAAIRYACWLPDGFAPILGHDNWRIDAARAGGGAVIDLAPHGIDLLAMLSGTRPVDVRVMLQHAVHPYAREGGVDDGGLVSVRYEGGLLASLSVAYNCPDALPRRRLELCGTEGAIVAENTMGQTAGGTLTFYGTDGTPTPFVISDDRPPFEVQIEAFGNRMRGRPDPAFASPEDVLAAHLLLIEALGAPQQETVSCP